MPRQRGMRSVPSLSAWRNRGASLCSVFLGFFLLSIIVFSLGETQIILVRKQQVGKLVSGAFKKFKEWWDRTKKPEVTEKAITSILEQLREAKVRADQHNEQQVPKTHRTDLGMER